MNRKISEEIRLQILHFLEQGLRSEAIASRLHLHRSTVMQWQYAFDRGDFRWLDPAYRASVVPQKALLAVRMFEQFGSYAAAARECGLRPSDVFRYVKNMAKYGIPLLPRGRGSASMKTDMKSRSRAKSLVSTKKPKTLKSAERLIAEQRIMIESLLESIDKHLGGEIGAQKKISSLTQQLRQHIAAGYPLPSLVDSPAPTGAPFIVVLEHLANECSKIRLSASESKLCSSGTKADTASGE